MHFNLTIITAKQFIRFKKMSHFQLLIYLINIYYTRRKKFHNKTNEKLLIFI